MCLGFALYEEIYVHVQFFTSCTVSLTQMNALQWRLPLKCNIYIRGNNISDHFNRLHRVKCQIYQYSIILHYKLDVVLCVYLFIHCF